MRREVLLSSELFGTLTGEVGRLLGADLAAIARYQTDATLSFASSRTASCRRS